MEKAAVNPAPTSWFKAVKRTADPGVFRSICGDALWRLGETNAIDPSDDPVLCKRGFHACQHPAAPFLCVLEYGYNHETDALLEVTLGGKVVSDGIKTAASSCTPLRVVSPEEWKELVRAPAFLKNIATGAEFYLQNGVLHREEDEPAVIWADGRKEWYRDGKAHRAGDKPALIWTDGSQEWYKDGKLHRDGDAPARIWTDGMQAWYKDGGLHRDGDKPAVIWQSGRQEWFREGKPHRDEDKPARVWSDGSQEWLVHGKLHRDGDEPARVWKNGSREWYKDGLLHRDGDEPAIIWTNGKREWYKNGVVVDCLAGK